MDTQIDLRDYEHVVFFTGAGLSAESGMHTYRGAGGIWSQYRWEDCACQRAFDRDPPAVLTFHEMRRGQALNCAPHEGHHHLARLQARHDGITVITQNIDGLLQRARVWVAAELHGSLWRLRCICGVRADTASSDYAEKQCAQCGRWLRPDITWFEDAVDQAVFQHAAAQVSQAELFVAVGTSGAVWPAAGFAQQAQDAGARMVEINPETTDASTLYDESVRLPVSRALPEYFV